MPVISSAATVLVTGANGYIGHWVVRTLLERGYSVRGTVRSETKAQELVGFVSRIIPQAKDRFNAVVVPDIAEAGAFDEAAKGLDGIIHTASPLATHTQVGDPQAYIRPAVEGTLNILKSAAKSDVKRVVVTSSMTAIISITALPRTYTEEDWNDSAVQIVEQQGRDALFVFMYDASKTLAERAAWDFVKKHKGEISFDLCTLLPTWVFGPLAGEHVPEPTALSNTPFHMWRQLAEVPRPAAETMPWHNYVDVRDVADLHVRALEVAAAGGERIICSSGVATWEEWLANVDLPGREKPSKQPSFPPHAYLENDKAISIFGKEFKELPEIARDVVEDYKSRDWLKYIKN
ncbi:D-lactaldehyde dehydrogenase [Trametes versicolor FP-101664 SS1]|uniref:D-lactaldehyde dehydrogenase n=1 Tax=Trametes versicolor (strain FP-101664) TaxID=717944 RepID=UPI000462418E|nr:D-lactaldehyde dehydrogenase [Trametes versicolor FP-101664 SS1]EIW53078.1 D-lactaldehyde dehydrogenase [Trametes versicolor FP-101664 SS1]